MVAYHLCCVRSMIRHTALRLPVHERLKGSHSVGVPEVKLKARAMGDKDHRAKIAETDLGRMNMAKR
jgi:hypothetical protein